MPYGQPLPDAAGDDGVDRGLVGIFLNADIERQYEFVHGNGSMRQASTGCGTRPTRSSARPVGTSPGSGDPSRGERVGLPRFVTVRGGEYFFVPGISALQFLSTTEASA